MSSHCASLSFRRHSDAGRDQRGSADFPPAPVSALGERPILESPEDFLLGSNVWLRKSHNAIPAQWIDNLLNCRPGWSPKRAAPTPGVLLACRRPAHRAMFGRRWRNQTSIFAVQRSWRAAVIALFAPCYRPSPNAHEESIRCKHFVGTRLLDPDVLLSCGKLNWNLVSWAASIQTFPLIHTPKETVRIPYSVSRRRQVPPHWH